MTAPADKKDCPLCKHFNVSIHENNAPADDLDTLVRDLTRTTPLPKSEVRARIKKYTEGEVVAARIEELSNIPRIRSKQAYIETRIKEIKGGEV